MASSANKPQSPGATSMAELMAKSSAKPMVSIKKGDLINGTITKLTRKEILVDIDAKSQALVLEKDPHMLKSMMSYLSEGQEVEVSILSPESETGQPIVSLRRYINNLIWKKLEEAKKTQEKIVVHIDEVTRGGFLVSTNEGLSGFLPNSHTTASQGPLVVGKEIQVSVADLNKEDNKIIFSQKTTMSAEEFASLSSEFKPKTKVNGEISSITNFGYFVLLHPKGTDHTIDGLIHISELSWNRVDDMAGIFKVGESIEAYVIGADRDSRRIDLSIKRLTLDPFEKIKEDYPLEKQTSSTVTRTEDGNVYVDLGEGVEGIIKKEKIPPTTIYEVGQVVTVTVTSHDPRRRRVELTPVLKEKPLMYR
ncbi:MAG: 30S ribosomal protein S1 [Candidatus Levybacteria bacterium]|nr:30S ribosomal protein S1 [Candidatus Levybacteria bacterium]